MLGLPHVWRVGEGWSWRSRRRSGWHCQHVSSSEKDWATAYGSVHSKDENQQEEREISCTKAGGEHENEAANEDNWHRVHVEPKTVAESVAHERVAQRPDHHEKVRRRNQEQTDGVAVAKRSCKRREEVLETVSQSQLAIIVRLCCE